MMTQDPYISVIAICLVILVSYFCGIIAKRTNIPSVLLLILLGVGIQYGLKAIHMPSFNTRLQEMLELLGIVGLIMIVLEAALDLKLTRDKKTLIGKSFSIALVALLGSSLAIAWIINRFIIDDFFTSLVYAVPLSIMSSAIIIPSVGRLVPGKKEFMIYESTFSDILGIMFFYFLIEDATDKTTWKIVGEVSLNITVTIGLSILVSYLLVLLFQRIEDKAKLFLLISILILLYAVGKKFHLSSLVVILIFGLVLNNYTVFFRGRIKKWINEDILNDITEELHVVTLESAFVVRTFFFVVFGMTLQLDSLLDLNTALISIGIVAALYVVRFVALKMFAMKSILPELFIAPRGLITVLLFFTIPVHYKVNSFSSGILLYSILLTAVIMTVALIFKSDETEYVAELNFEDWEELDKAASAVPKETTASTHAASEPAENTSTH